MFDRFKHDITKLEFYFKNTQQTHTCSILVHYIPITYSSGIRHSGLFN